MKLINEKSVYFKRTLHNFRIQLLLYQQLFSPSTQRTAMRNNFLLVGSNLTLAYFEEKSLWILPQIYAKDFVGSFIHNYFRFFDDVFHKWLIQINTQDLYRIINELDSDFRFILEELKTNINFHDINLAIINKLHFDIYHKPTILVLGKLKNLNKKLQD